MSKSKKSKQGQATKLVDIKFEESRKEKKKFDRKVFIEKARKARRTFSDEDLARFEECKF